MASYGPSSAFVPGRFNIWLPNTSQNAYLSFDTAAEAQAAQVARSSGVILDPAGKVDPNLQAWSGWTTFQSQVPQVQAPVVLNPSTGTTAATARPGAAPAIPVVPSTPQADKAPVAGKYNVFVPSAYLPYLGLGTNAGAPNVGAFFAFATAQEAQAYASAKNVGVVVEPGGVLSATQPWVQWSNFAAQIEDFRLEKTPAPNKYNVFLPQGYVNVQAFQQTGGYLSFDSAADAQASVTRRQAGVVLTPSGALDATQPWQQWTAVYGQIPAVASKLSKAAVAGKFNVWVPPTMLWNIGVQPGQQFPYGTYQAFDSAADAQAMAKQMMQGYVINPQGDLDPTQPNANAAQAAPMLLNPKLTARPTAGTVNVWFPTALLNNVGVVDTAPYAQGGVYLPFKTEADAQAHVTARGFGIVLDAAGAASATQPWNQATTYLAQLSNDKLTPKRTAGQYAVWFPQQELYNIGVYDAGKFPEGAYLAFATAAEAQAHATQRNEGVVLDPNGNLEATQVWPQAAQFGAQLLNPKLTTKPTPGQFNVWFPVSMVGSLATPNNAQFSTTGAYLAFPTEAEAQAHVNARTFGVVLDTAGKAAATQSWAYAPQSIAQLENVRLTTSPAAGQYNVWLPTPMLYSAGITDQTKFPNGAYLSYATEAEAQAHVKARSFGVVLDPSGAAAATQAWNQAPQFVVQLTNVKLTPKRVDGQYAVWFPQAYLGGMGVGDATKFPEGAYMSFATAAEAQAHVTARQSGVILDPAGNIDATQVWNMAPMVGAQLLNARLTAAPTAGKFNVWFPHEVIGNIGVADATKFPQGAYLAFATEAEAQAHAKARNVGVVFDASGAATATQVWAQSARYIAQQLNSQLTLQRTDGKYSVWFPAAQLYQIGVHDPSKFPVGAYLAFDSKQAAVTHVTQRGKIGVLVNERGVADTTQLWPGALDAVANNPALQLPPPSGWVEGPAPLDATTAANLGSPTAGSVAIGSVTPTANGADIVAYVATVRPPDSFRFFIGAQINGSWMPIFNVPDLVRLSGAGWQVFKLHVDYSQVDGYLQGVNPNLKLTPNMTGAVGIKFTSGHDTGIPGWSQNQGTEKDATTTLPPPASAPAPAAAAAAAAPAA